MDSTAPGTPPSLPFAIHHHMITQIGIHHLENSKLDQMARAKVWTSCTIVLPLLEKGVAGSAIRPVAIRVPGKQQRQKQNPRRSGGSFRAVTLVKRDVDA